MDADVGSRPPPRRRALADGRVVEVAAEVGAAELTAVAAALERRVPTPVWRRAGIIEAVGSTATAAPSGSWAGLGRGGR
ncbi:MAG: hypothetical protein ACQETV_05775 [Actinomycetota bacterium]